MIDRIVPKCARTDEQGRSHHCTELCPDADGAPCVAPPGDWWRPRGDAFQPGSFQHNYRRLREAVPGDLDEKQRRYLRWLAQWDLETTDMLAEFFEIASGSSPRVVATRRSRARRR